MTATGSHWLRLRNNQGQPGGRHRLASVDATRPCGPRPVTEPRGRVPIPATPFTSGLPSSSRSSPVGLQGVTRAPTKSVPTDRDVRSVNGTPHARGRPLDRRSAAMEHLYGRHCQKDGAAYTELFGAAQEEEPSPLVRLRDHRDSMKWTVASASGPLDSHGSVRRRATLVSRSGVLSQQLSSHDHQALSCNYAPPLGLEP